MYTAGEDKTGAQCIKGHPLEGLWQHNQGTDQDKSETALTPGFIKKESFKASSKLRQCLHQTGSWFHMQLLESLEI